MQAWPEKVKTMQKNWIGKSVGCEIDFEIDSENKNIVTDKIRIFTTRPDTIFGATFCALSPFHPLVDELMANDHSLSKEIKDLRSQKISEESIAKNEKIGLKTHVSIKHPFIKNKLLPVYIANFILMDYGSGAIYGCPAHDQRDLDFANKYNLEVIQVIDPEDTSVFDGINAYVGGGKLINSEFLDGLTIDEADRGDQKIENASLGKKLLITDLEIGVFLDKDIGVAQYPLCIERMEK